MMTPRLRVYRRDFEASVMRFADDAGACTMPALLLNDLAQFASPRGAATRSIR